MASEVGVIARPPSDVHRCSRGIMAATPRAASITSSSGMSGSKPASAMLAQHSAFAAAITFLPRHGASTRLAIGSQIRPSMLWKAIEAAATAWSRVPPASVTRAAAAMLAAAPPSA